MSLPPPGKSTPPASVIVRTLDSERTLPAALGSLRRQTLDPEIVVVDSGSTDGTLEIAERLADHIVHIAKGEFTFGRALNRGAQAARAPVHFALSSHCAAQTDDWIERSLAHYADPKVAATNGQAIHPDGRLLEAVLRQDQNLNSHNPYWTYSNHAGSWRAEVWRRFPFDEQMVAAEDAEWSHRVRQAGWVIVFDPALFVPSEHRRQQGVRALMRRTKKETLGIASFTPMEPLTASEAVRRWWSADHHYPGAKAWRQRLSPFRVAELAGEWSAGRVMRDHQRSS